MKPRLYALAACLIIQLVGFTAYNAVTAHDDTHPQSMQAVLPGQLAEVGWFDEAPNYATNCTSYLRPTTSTRKTSAIATCYNWSGSGSVRYQVAALAFDGCNQYIWMYGNVAWVYVRGITTNGKQSVVYVGPGKWHFVAKKTIVWKP